MLYIIKIPPAWRVLCSKRSVYTKDNRILGIQGVILFACQLYLYDAVSLSISNNAQYAKIVVDLSTCLTSVTRLSLLCLCQVLRNSLFFVTVISSSNNSCRVTFANIQPDLFLPFIVRSMLRYCIGWECTVRCNLIFF